MMTTIINGNLGRYLIYALFIILIGVVGWVAQGAKSTVDGHETRIRAGELSDVRFEIKLDYLIDSVDELKEMVKQPNR